MPEELSSPSTAETLGECVEQRFGIVPNFFRLAPETPEITEKLWGFAQAAYLDNLLPSVLLPCNNSASFRASIRSLLLAILQQGVSSRIADYKMADVEASRVM
jgi:hypothetical protein